VDVVNLDGKKVGEVELADAVFGAKSIRICCTNFALVLNGCVAAPQGQGKAKVRRRPQTVEAEGTGRARVGSIRSPLWRHAAQFTDHVRAATATICQEMLLGHCVRAFRQVGGLEIDHRRCWQLESHKTQSLLTTLESWLQEIGFAGAYGENRNLELVAAIWKA